MVKFPSYMNLTARLRLCLQRTTTQENCFCEIVTKKSALFVGVLSTHFRCLNAVVSLLAVESSFNDIRPSEDEESYE